MPFRDRSHRMYDHLWGMYLLVWVAIATVAFAIGALVEIVAAVAPASNRASNLTVAAAFLVGAVACLIVFVSGLSSLAAQRKADQRQARERAEWARTPIWNGTRWVTHDGQMWFDGQSWRTIPTDQS